jgi:beta-lactamase regulating signal transducer with metallopeptidase domain
MSVMHAMLGNAAVAAVLALLALAAGRVCRSAAVRHLLWVLVLLKLVTPPLFHVPLAVLPASWEAPPAEPSPLVGGVLLPLPTPPAPPIAPAPSVERAPTWWERFRGMGADHWVMTVWLTGAAGWFVWQGRRIIRFRRWIARAQDAGPEVAAAAHRIARSLGIACPPAVKAASGIGSPMLWGWGRSTVVLFPRELLARLSPEARDTLLAHELAHFLRGDHWVRLLEFVATGLYWWHPAVWLARTGIEAAEEECCDAWVVGGLAASPRRYAEALLATIDFVAELRRPCLPPGACPANRDARLLQRRLAAIVHAERPRPLRGRGVAVRMAVVAALLVQPILRAATPTEVAEAPPDTVFAPVRAEAPRSPAPSPRPRPKSVEPPAWASAPAPGGQVTAMARDREVVLRRADGTVTVLGPGKPLALAFAPNHQRLATAGPGTLVRTWDYEGNKLAEARVPAAARSIAYTPDGRSLLVLDAAGGISVLDPSSLATVSAWSVEGPANSIACGPDSQTVAVAFGSWLDAETGGVECWSIPQQRKLASYSASAPVGAARFGPDGRTLVVGGWNGLLTWRILPGGELVAERQLPKGLVSAAAFSPDAGTLPLEPPPEPAEALPEPLPLSMPELPQEISRLPGR